MTEVLTQPQKRIVVFSGTASRDPGVMIDKVNTEVNHWLENAFVLIRDVQLIPQTCMQMHSDETSVYTAYFYTVSIVFTEDVSDIADDDDEPNGGC